MPIPTSATPSRNKQLGTRLLLASLLLLGSAALRAQGTAPTASLTPEQKDERWQVTTSAIAATRDRALTTMQSTIAAGPYRADWESLAQHRTPDWFADAKFGIFIHWGLFSVPAWGNEWYARNMYQKDSPEYKHHIATYGPQAKFGYKDFIPMFRMEHFDPEAWANLFVQSGAKYVVPVAEHHDGFAMYPTALSPWNAAEMGPHRNLVGDLGTAVRSHGLKLGVSLHRAEHDWFFDGGRTFDSDVNDPRFAGLYGPAEHRNLQSENDAVLNRDYTYVSQGFRQDWLAHATELVGLFHPDLLYFDWWVGMPDFRESQEHFAAFFYDQAARRNQPVVMFSKNDNMAEHAGTLDIERGGLTAIRTEPWQTDTSISNAGWGYLEHDTFKSSSVLIDQLVDIVSKNGNLLLNIGPKPDGTIPEPVQKTLLEIGAWLKINGDAIYGTRPWKHFGEGPTNVQAGSFQDKAAPTYTPSDFRFTQKGDTVYAIALRPQGPNTVLHSFTAGSGAGTVKAVRLLGSPETLRWQQNADGLHLQSPSQSASTLPSVFAIDLQP